MDVVAFRAKYNDWALFAFRVFFGLLFLTHGLSKFGIMKGAFAMPGSNLMLVAAIIEVVGGILIAIGLFTSWAAFVASGMTAFAFFIGHASGDKGFWPWMNGGEMAVLYCFAFLYLAFEGAGKYSVDARCCKVTDAKK